MLTFIVAVATFCFGYLIACLMKGSPRTRQIDSKYAVVDGDIVTTRQGHYSKPGDIIPLDEPLFLLRGRDTKAVETLTRYAELSAIESCCNAHMQNVLLIRTQFEIFAKDNPERMRTSGRPSVGPVCR